MADALTVLILVLAVGVAAQPIARAALAPLPAAGAGVAFPLGLLLAAMPVWLLASLHVLPYTVVTARIGAVALLVAGAVVWWRTRGKRETDDRRLVIGAQLVFVVVFVLGAIHVAYAPDVWQTEKPTDMMFVQAINDARHFPPHDPWLSGSDLNYYYLGSYVMAWITRVAGIGATPGYNLGIALIWALGASTAYGLAGTLASAWRGRRLALPAGFAAALLVAVGGNVRGLRDVLQHGTPVDTLNWFAATRQVPGGINDFPSFEAVLGDLHAHVIVISVTFLVLAFAAHAAIHGPQLHWRIVPAAVALGAIYPMNAWAAPVAFGFVLIAGAVGTRGSPLPAAARQFALWAAPLVALAILLYLPFLLNFDSGGAQGVALVSDRRPLGHFLVDLFAVYGFALVPVLGYLIWRLRPAWLWGALVLVIPLALVKDLGGPLLLALLCLAAVAIAWRVADRAERLLALVILGGLACVLGPELIRIKDIFNGTAFERMNTLFKLGFNGWLLLGLGGAVVIGAAWAALPQSIPVRIGRVALAGVATAALLVFPVAASVARTAKYAGPARLDGLRWLDQVAPGDRGAIDWIDHHTPRDAVVLEGLAPEYSPDGGGRISTFTGRPTIVQWIGHELNWRGKGTWLGNRQADATNLYTSTDLTLTRTLAAQYKVKYVVVGPYEQTYYPGAGLDKFKSLGDVVYNRGGTTIYRLRLT